jgi:hypothetical protein
MEKKKIPLGIFKVDCHSLIKQKLTAIDWSRDICFLTGAMNLVLQCSNLLEK